jgi:hypothetical protein
VVGLEEFEVIRRDLEGVVEAEIERLDTIFDFKCRKARVWEDQHYFEFNVEEVFGDLPAIRSFYVKKTRVVEIEMKVEVLARPHGSYHIASIRFYFVYGGVCYKDYNIYTARLNDLAHSIIEISTAEADTVE